MKIDLHHIPAQLPWAIPLAILIIRQIGITPVLLGISFPENPDHPSIKLVRLDFMGGHKVLIPTMESAERHCGTFWTIFGDIVVADLHGIETVVTRTEALGFFDQPKL